MVQGSKKLVRSSGLEHFMKMVHSHGQEEVDQLE